MVSDPEPDQQVKAAGDDAHVLRLGHGPDRTDDLAQVHPGPGRHGEIDDDREAERRPVDVYPVSADHAGAFQPGEPVSHGGRRHVNGAGERALRLAGVHRERAQQRQVELIDLGLRRGRCGDLALLSGSGL